MQYRKLGGSGPDISAIGLGCGPMSRTNAPTDDVESVATVHEALDGGTNFLDTAESYGKGSHNESLLGKALKGYRDKAVVATKFGIYHEPTGRRNDGSPANAVRACDGSLKRLGIDSIDLYYLHRIDPKVPLEDSIGAMAGLVKAGKVKQLGMSMASADELRRACKVHPIAAVQSAYSLFNRKPETDVLPTCRELGITFVAYWPLWRGALGGTFYDISRQTAAAPGTREEVEPRTQAIRDMASKKGITPSQLALAWILAKDPNVVPIPGTRRRKYLNENAAAADVKLTPQEVATLDAAYPINVDAYPKG
jgi:aryl-alcohol dehydrogenase-like predicted oxidoreductase